MFSWEIKLLIIKILYLEKPTKFANQKREKFIYMKVISYKLKSIEQYGNILQRSWRCNSNNCNFYRDSYWLYFSSTANIELHESTKKVNNDKRFEVYHNLIDHFAGANGTAKLDRQIAIVYEMRRFPEYFPLTKRIFTDWKNGILQNSVNPNIQRLITEIDITLEFINSNWYKRKYSFKDK